ncbi:MAG: 30S ribosomal protein S17 [Candidatus Dormibacteraceae bacterium]
MSETVATTTATSARGRRKVRVGRVISDRMEKTVVVLITDLKQHPLYRKTIRQRVKFKAHDQENTCGVGDLVRIMETRPISKEKRWRVVEILEKAK